MVEKRPLESLRVHLILDGVEYPGTLSEIVEDSLINAFVQISVYPPVVSPGDERWDPDMHQRCKSMGVPRLDIFEKDK